MSTLALVVLSCLATSPGVEISVLVNGRSMLITTSDLDDVLALEALDDLSNIWILRYVRFVLHV